MIAMQRSIRISWVEYRDSAVLNVAYTILFWKEGPGWVEVNVKSVSELDAEIEQLTDQFVQSFLKKLHEDGFQEASRYASRMHALKLDAKEAIDQAFREAQEINNEVIGKTTGTIENLARIKLGAAVGVAVISGTAGVLAVAGATSVLGVSAGAGPLVFAAVGLTNSVTHSVIKTWEDGDTAKAVAIDFGKAGLSDGAGKAAEIAGEKATANFATKVMARNNAEVAVRRYADILGRRSTTPANIAKRTQRLAHAQGALGQAQVSATRAAATNTVARGVGYALPVVFAAWDILDAVETYNEDLKGL